MTTEHLIPEEPPQDGFTTKVDSTADAAAGVTAGIALFVGNLVVAFALLKLEDNRYSLPVPEILEWLVIVVFVVLPILELGVLFWSRRRLVADGKRRAWIALVVTMPLWILPLLWPWFLILYVIWFW